MATFEKLLAANGKCKVGKIVCCNCCIYFVVIDLKHKILVFEGYHDVCFICLSLCDLAVKKIINFLPENITLYK